MNRTNNQIIKTDLDGIVNAIGKEQRLRKLLFWLQGSLHPKLDLQLCNNIESHLEPLLGRSGIDDEKWFMSLDWYGDGVRRLEFQNNVLTIEIVKSLQALLRGLHSQFVILCWGKVGPWEKRIGALILNKRIYITFDGTEE